MIFNQKFEEYSLKFLWFIFLFISSELHANIIFFTDNFQTNTISEYITEDTWTASGTGSLLYDGTSQRARLLTGDNIALAFSKTLPSTIEGSFSIDFLPTKYYPNGGIFTLKLIQDANNYYQIENTDNYGTREVAKYVNGVKVEAKPFTAEYTQGINYTITVNFSPESTNIEAFGQTIILDTNNAEIDVSAFWVNTLQQDAYYDDIVYSVVQTGGNTPPTANAGEDQSVEVNQTIQINGTGNDSDGTIVSYQWSNDSVVVANTASFTYTPDTVESQTLTLTVTDNNGTTASDEMVLTVTAVPLPNTPPTANAGVDKSTQVNQSVTINGTGNDSDGSITSYEWISGSTVLSNSASFTYTPTIEGNETLTLTVTDNEGATASDDMLLTVTPAPIETNAFTDNFQTNTISEYITEDTWTASGTGSLLYDGTSQRARLLTGDNVALKFSKMLPGSNEGSFSIDFLPIVNYPGGGVFTLKLIQDANNYYLLLDNTDSYGTSRSG